MKRQKNNPEKTEFWQKQIEAVKKFQGSKTAFCRTNSLSVHTLNYYIKKFSKEKKLPRVTRPFVEVVVENPINQIKRGSLPDPKWLEDGLMEPDNGLASLFHGLLKRHLAARPN